MPEQKPSTSGGAAHRSAAQAADPVQGIRRASLHQEVVPRLRDMIFEGELAPGDRIPERVVCERFGISRTPLREALMVLAAEGLVDLSPHRGATVSRLDPESLDHMFEVMEALEGLAGHLSCRYVTDEQIEQLGTMHRQMVQHFERQERREYFQLNQEIHLKLVELSGNPVLLDLYTGLSGRIRRARYLANFDGERWRQAVEEHERMLALLAARDGERLSALLVEHLQHKHSVLKAGVLQEAT